MDQEEHRLVNSWVVTFAVMLATFMEILDATVVNVSIPHIVGSLAATIEEGTWVVTSYLVSNAIILLMSVWLANTLERLALRGARQGFVSSRTPGTVQLKFRQTP
jgi:DHA2 family multidrug resistance protein